MKYESRFRWGLSNFIQNTSKRKFKSMFRFLFDGPYRAEVSRMVKIVRAKRRVLSHGQVPLGQMAHSHPLNYHTYVDNLVLKINREGWKKLEPITVVWDLQRLEWLVVDGNHRLAALKRTLPKSIKIPVIILRGVDEVPFHYEQQFHC